ncbi:ribonuclease-like [Emydura macquarii macquarii]|uniref:ribonuclease-like n=1 Tax=Emydura macquarii macquarii TaxID=1129001 RepID=UPI003529ED3D
MALPGSCPLLLLPLVLLGACLAVSVRELWTLENDKFLLQHWNYPRSPEPNGTYCEVMMARRELSGKDNTFIHAPVGAINNVCNLAGRPGRPNERHSVAAFDITLCTFNATSQAYAEARYRRRLVLACWKGVPVGYVRHI